MLTVLLIIIYISFISLGLPDSLLGSAWPAVHSDLGVQLSFAGVISMIVSCGTVISSHLGERRFDCCGAAGFWFFRFCNMVLPACGTAGIGRRFSRRCPEQFCGAPL